LIFIPSPIGNLSGFLACDLIARSHRPLPAVSPLNALRFLTLYPRLLRRQQGGASSVATLNTSWPSCVSYHGRSTHIVNVKKTLSSCLQHIPAPVTIRVLRWNQRDASFGKMLSKLAKFVSSWARRPARIGYRITGWTHQSKENVRNII